MSHAIVKRGGKEKKVKNLGWLLKHADEVEKFTLYEGVDGGAHMTAHLTDGGTFTILWASAKVMSDWLKRPSFRGTPVERRMTPPDSHHDSTNDSQYSRTVSFKDAIVDVEGQFRRKHNAAPDSDEWRKALRASAQVNSDARKIGKREGMSDSAIHQAILQAEVKAEGR